MKRANLQCSDEELMDLIGQLSSEGTLGFRDTEGFSSFPRFLGDPYHSWWVYVILLLSTAEMLLVAFGFPDPLSVFFRLVLGLAFLGFMPGYSTFRTVFPLSELTFLERIVLSIFLSVLVSILSGTILGSLRLLEATANVIVLTAFTFAMTLAASYRSFSLSRANQAQTLVSS